MLEYHAAYYPIEQGWFLAKVLDFPGALSQGKTLKSARRMLRDSLEGLILFHLEKGNPLPQPKKVKDSKATFQELIRVGVRCLPTNQHEKAKTPSTFSAARVRL